MPVANNIRVALPVSALLALLSACAQNVAVPSSSTTFAQQSATRSPLDTTSILKQDKKDVVIGSTVDPSNGDLGPHGLWVVPANVPPLKKGELIACNFANSKGQAGGGTTIELLDPTPGSSPTRFAQSDDIKGCTGVTVSPTSGYVYGAGHASGVMTAFNTKGAEQQTYGPPLAAPFSDVDVSCYSGPAAIEPARFCGYSAEYIFTSDAKKGSIVSAGVNIYASGFYMQVATGFGHKGKGWGILGPAGLQYTHKHDTLYIADGVTNTVVEFTNASNLLTKNEIIVGKTGKTFKCAHAKTTCGKLVKAGSPLNAPIAMALLPNGNLIVSNGAAPRGGGNELVEMTPTGQILDTRVVDSGKAPAVFGLASNGTKDGNTVIYYADTNDNKVHELKP